MSKKRKTIDRIYNSVTGILSSFGIIILLAILYFIFSNGISQLSFKMIFGNYYDFVFNTKLTEDVVFFEYENPNIEGAYFSKQWGIALKDGVNQKKDQVVFIVYVDKYSPFNNLHDVATLEYISIGPGQEINKIFLEDESGEFIMALNRDKAKIIVDKLDRGIKITDMVTQITGGGIRGSLLTTLYLILLTLIIALPLGVTAAIYLSEFSIDNRFTRILRSMIDMTSGIPSIIFGLVGAIVFIPFMNTLIRSQGGSIASGALTMTIILLPIIIRTTEEQLKVIPRSYRSASLALGASRTQTTFKVVLPNALPGILTATILSIGRIIGESAALIYAIGTAIKDQVRIEERSTTLAVHIWTLMSGDKPNFQLSSSISIIILLVVFVLSFLVKLLGKKLIRFSEVK